MCGFDARFEFALRADGNVHVVQEDSRAVPATAFRDVCWNGHDGPSNLTCQAILFGRRKLPGDTIEQHQQVHPALPHFQLAIREHAPEPSTISAASRARHCCCYSFFRRNFLEHRRRTTGKFCYVGPTVQPPASASSLRPPSSSTASRSRQFRHLTLALSAAS